MSAGLKSNSQKIVHLRPSPFANRRFDDNSAFSMTHSCVHKYLMDPSERPQRMTITCGQNIDRQFISMSVDQVSRETSLKLAESKYFEAAFHLSDNRKSVRKAAEQARQFYKEHLIQRNPFPPKHTFQVVLEKPKNVKKAKSGPESVKKTESSVSLLEGTMSLTSMSSHSQLSATSPSHPINLKTPKKKVRHRIPDSQHFDRKREMISLNSPLLTNRSTTSSSKDENRLMNTFNTPE